MHFDDLAGDLIFVNGIEFTGYHGILPDELTHGRRYKVDLVIAYPFHQAAASDRISDTIDYRGLLTLVHRRGTQPDSRCNLIERLAVLIAEDILADTRAQSCAVTLWKFTTDLPVQSVAVRVVRHRKP